MERRRWRRRRTGEMTMDRGKQTGKEEHNMMDWRRWTVEVARKR
jgi:hypothetical protein